MTGWLLDTNVVSEFRRPRPEPKVSAFIAAQPLDQLYLSVVTLMEIRFGIESVEDVPKRMALASWLENELRPMFDGRVLQLDEDVLLRWRIMVQQGKDKGRTYQQPDLFIAATAFLHGLAVVTRNTGDFQDVGVQIVNPWDT